MIANIEHMGQTVQVSTVVVYDPIDGRIICVHHTMTSNGGQHPDEKGLETAALALASQRETHKKLAVLHVPYREFKGNVRYKVDIQNSSLVEIA